MHIANFSHLQIIHLFTSIAHSQTREKKFQIWYIDEVTTDLCYHLVRVENTCIFTVYFKYTFSFSCNCSMQKMLVYRLFYFIFRVRKITGYKSFEKCLQPNAIHSKYIWPPKQDRWISQLPLWFCNVVQNGQKGKKSCKKCFFLSGNTNEKSLMGI